MSTNQSNTIYFRPYKEGHNQLSAIFPPPFPPSSSSTNSGFGLGGVGGPTITTSAATFATILSNGIMERGGLDNISEAGLCLQDLVAGGTGNNSDHHLHNHHSLHDPVSAAVSVSSAITGLMSAGSGGSGLSHLHHGSTHDISSHHHHHSVVPHTPSLHEPLEKLKCKFFLLEFLLLFNCIIIIIFRKTSIKQILRLLTNLIP